MLSYWLRVARFARGAPPREVADVPVWALCAPFVLWYRPKRHDGRSFADSYAPRAGALVRSALRWLYLAFLLCWPIVALAYAIGHRSRAVAWYRTALRRPDLAMLHPDAFYTEREVAWMRPDYALSMLYAHEYAKAPKAYHRLDHKRTFLDRAREAGLPLCRELTLAEALQWPDRVVVKDSDSDLGYGVDILTPAELAEDPDRETLILQPVLKNHADLFAAYPPDAPLSTLRVITLADPEPRILRCAVRIGRAGSPVDNTQQGGIWANVELPSGKLLPGVTKKDVGHWRGSEPVRHLAHPDTGRAFVGIVVPWYEEGRRLALQAHRDLAPDALTLGFDIALAETGPVFLEVNVWTVCYDIEPPDDAFTPCCAAIVSRMQTL